MQIDISEKELELQTLMCEQLFPRESCRKSVYMAGSKITRGKCSVSWLPNLNSIGPAKHPPFTILVKVNLSEVEKFPPQKICFNIQKWGREWPIVSFLFWRRLLKSSSQLRWHSLEAVPARGMMGLFWSWRLTAHRGFQRLKSCWCAAYTKGVYENWGFWAALCVIEFTRRINSEIR